MEKAKKRRVKRDKCPFCWGSIRVGKDGLFYLHPRGNVKKCDGSNARP